MLRLLFAFAVICIIIITVRLLRAYFARDQKTQQLARLKQEGEIIKIDKQIAEEKASQSKVPSEIDTIESNNNKQETKYE